MDLEAINLGVMEDGKRRSVWQGCQYTLISSGSCEDGIWLLRHNLGITHFSSLRKWNYSYSGSALKDLLHGAGKS